MINTLFCYGQIRVNLAPMVQSCAPMANSRHRGIQLVILGNPSTDSGYVSPVIHDLEGRNIAGNLPDYGSKCVKRAEPGQNIKCIRLKKRMSQGDICRAIDMDRSYTSVIEGDKVNVTIAVLEKLAHALDVSVDELKIGARQKRGYQVGNMN